MYCLEVCGIVLFLFGDFLVIFLLFIDFYFDFSLIREYTLYEFSSFKLVRFVLWDIVYLGTVRIT